MNKPINRANAKEEIERINTVLTVPHMLIGGLAVQQYHVPRVSQDIDMICDFKTAQNILNQLYPSMDWKVSDHRDDDYRPSYRIKHKIKDKGTIVFGPKILERDGYSNLDWDILHIGAKNFTHKNKQLTNIKIPTAHALAYTKLISFLGRKDNEPKTQNDLKDFINLTNHDEFSSSAFYDLLRRSGIEKKIISDFNDSSKKYINMLGDSSLFALVDLFRNKREVHYPKSKKNENKAISVYLAGPHRNIARNRKLSEAIKSFGFKVINPYEEVAAKHLKEEAANAVEIREVCMDAISRSDIVLVDLDTYGMDTAWELGYSAGKSKKIIGYNEDKISSTEVRFINRRKYNDNFMHGWANQAITNSIDKIIKDYKDKSIYVCGSFNNPSISHRLKTQLKSVTDIAFPKEHLDNKCGLPQDYPFSDRTMMNKLVQKSDILLVILPRYGMDVSWQIGYASAYGKEVVGMVLEDDNRHMTKESFWNHWMHGWKQKPRAVGLKDLESLLVGYRETNNLTSDTERL